jgi:hypothetical protein
LLDLLLDAEAEARIGAEGCVQAIHVVAQHRRGLNRKGSLAFRDNNHDTVAGREP